MLVYLVASCLLQFVTLALSNVIPGRGKLAGRHSCNHPVEVFLKKKCAPEMKAVDLVSFNNVLSFAGSYSRYCEINGVWGAVRGSCIIDFDSLIDELENEVGGLSA